MKVLEKHRCFDGNVEFWEHESKLTSTKMKFSTFRPERKASGCLIWLSGLTCTEENFITKAGSQRFLAERGLMVICPDTSPRGLNLPGEHDSHDFGSGAGFYVDALTEGYRDHYKMYSYISVELYSLVQKQFGFTDNISIFGHSMGGHGALILGLREPRKFRSVSAFAPIASPTGSAWGQKALRGYLGNDESLWSEYDTCKLLEAGKKRSGTILVDQGTNDEFMDEHLLPKQLQEACLRSGQELQMNYRKGYDHSYYFVSTFMESHVDFHAKHF